MMTIRSHQAMRIANAIKDARRQIEADFASETDAALTGAEYAARCLTDELARYNPQFDRERFLAACGV